MAASLPARPTFFKDVVPILQAHCVQCHRPGQIAPMALITYEQARPWASAIKEAVLMRSMPPWPAAAPLGYFANDWRLTDEKIAVIRRWAESGAPAGEPKESPPPQASTDGWQMGRPDLVLSMAHEQRIPGVGAELWKYILFDRVFDRDTWIRGLEIRPSNRKVVHHANIQVLTPSRVGAVDWSSVPQEMEAPGNQPPKLSGFHMVQIHVGVPGQFSFETQSGSAVLIPRGSRIRINIHYAPTLTPQTDRTEVGLYFASGRIEKEWLDQLGGLGQFQIPARAPGYELRSDVKVEVPITVYQVGCHMHIRGKSYRIVAELPDGRKIELLNVPKYNFDWQFMYRLARPVSFPAGTVLHHVATFDNSAANPLVLKYDTPDREVFRGERTIDEMMAGFVMHTVDPEKLDGTIDGRTGTAFEIEREAVVPGRVTASRQNGDHLIDRAFDSSTAPDDFWEVSGSFPVNLDAAFDHPIAIADYEFLCGENADRMPRAWKVFGSIDGGSTWTELDARKQDGRWPVYSRRTYTIPRPARYGLYRIEFDGSFDPNILRIYEVRFYR